MSDQAARDQQHGKRVRDWLLALLRFAITRDPVDQAAAIELARQMDAGESRSHGAVTFFVRTSHNVCQAITAAADANRAAVLARHVAQIEDPRLREAFRAAVGIERKSDTPGSATPGRSGRVDLWKGLPSRPKR